MKRIAIIVAMQSEFDLVSNILEHAESCEIEGAKALVGELFGKQIILSGPQRWAGQSPAAYGYRCGQAPPSRLRP